MTKYDKVSIFRKIASQIRDNEFNQNLVVLRDELNSLFQRMNEEEKSSVRKSWNKYRK